MNYIREQKHSKKIMASYGCGDFFTNFISGVLAVTVYFFYEAEIGLESWIAALGFVIFAIWDAFNDPIIGYITDRPFRFTKKWGRRFPWMMLSFIPMILTFILIFTPPNVDPTSGAWILFGWLVFSTCLYDVFETIFMINFRSLFPDKFRDVSERFDASAIGVYIGFIGIVIGFIIPPIVIVFGDLSTYALLAWICVIIMVFAGILMIPGVRDDKKIVEQYLETYEKIEKAPFFKILIKAFKLKNFIIFLLFFLLYQTLNYTVLASILYFVRFVLEKPAGTTTSVMIMLLVGGLISVPFWLKFTKKTHDNRKTLVLGGSLICIFTFSLSFITELTWILIAAFLFGFGLGGLWSMLAPTLSDVIDESVIKTGERHEGIYSSFQYFMGNLARVNQAIIFAIVHTITGFSEGSDIQTPLAVLGIQLHTGIIPATLMAIGVLVFWKFYEISPEKAAKNKEKLAELKL